MNGFNRNRYRLKALAHNIMTPVKPSVKTITIKTLLTVILSAALIMTIVIGLSFRTLSHNIVKNHVLTLSELVKAGLTSHMKADIMDKRDYFLEEIQSIHDIQSMKILRSEEINKQFGPGSRFEGKVDDVAKKVFKSGEPAYILNEFALNPRIRAVIPFVATKEGALSCITCHQVVEGTVLGAVDIEVDLSGYRNTALTVMLGIAVLSAIFVILIITNTFRTVQIYVKAPLESLVENAKKAYHGRTPLVEDDFQSLEFQNVAREINLFNDDIARNQKLMEEKNLQLAALNDEIEDTLKETVFTMGIIEEKKSKETKNHTRRVTEYCRLLAQKLGLSDEEVEVIAAAAPLHDIGKIGISDYILLKDGKLTEEEHQVMKNHTKIGYSMLVHSKRDILQAAAIIAHQHHEKWDGTGYPQALKSEKIHIYGRIAAIADVFDALASKRSYKAPWSIEAITVLFKAERGKHFDPTLLDLFLGNLDEFTEILEEYS